MRKKTHGFFLGFLLLLLVSNVGNYWYFNVYCGNLYKEQAAVYEQELASYKTQFYTAVTDIPAGTKVTLDLLELTDGSLSNRTGLFGTSDINKTAIASIAAGTPLYGSMVYDETIEAGNTAQYTGIRFPSNAAAGSFVDIRIRFRNGNDYIIVSKTKLTDIDHGSETSLLTLKELELLYLSSALTDGELYEAELYATVYSSPETQPPSEITYIPQIENLPLIYPPEDLRTYENARRMFELQIGEPTL